MFQGWGFLLGEIWVLLALAALLGLCAGWLIWGGRRPEAGSASLQRALEDSRAEARACAEALAAAQAVTGSRATSAVPAKSPEPSEASRPRSLAGARGGVPDDLERISGIGPKLAKLCHDLGYYHFDQIAAWTPEEIAWVDTNLEGFKGRVSRDAWVDQARALATGTRDAEFD